MEIVLVVMTEGFAAQAARWGGRWCVPCISSAQGIIAQGALTLHGNLLIGFSPQRRWTKRDVLSTVEFLLARFRREPCSRIIMQQHALTTPHIRVQRQYYPHLTEEQLEDALYLGNT